MVNLELYRVFYTVAKCGSLTKAAEQLFISQPAVSQAIKQLENQLGGKLFNRVSRGMELTDEGGKLMFENVSKAIEILDSAENTFSDLKNIASGTIRIAASDYVTTFFLIEYIIKFKELYPNVSLSFLNSTSKECVEQIKSGNCDIGFLNLPTNYSGVNFAGQTGKIHDVFVASPKFMELFDKEIELASLCDYPILMMDNKTVMRKSVDTFTEGLNITFNPDFELGSVELLVTMAVKGLGIACIPREFITRELNEGSLKEINTNPSLPVRAIGVIVKDEKSHSFAVNEFLKLVTKSKKI